MKPLLTLLALATITATAHADNNNKAIVKPQVQQADTMAATAATDTTWHGTGTHYDYGQREYDPRIKRYMPVNPSAQPHSSSPYQFSTNNPVKQDK